MKVLKDNHGFTLVEILATMAILIILMGVGAAAYTKYRKDSLNKSYDLIQKNVVTAAENYFIDNIYDTNVDINDLVDQGYLDTVIDPAHKDKTCNGRVVLLGQIQPENPEAIQSSSLKVSLECGKEKRCMLSNSKLGCDPEGGIKTDGESTYYGTGLVDVQNNPVNMKSETFINGISMAMRVKFNDLKTGTMEYFGNWENGGGGHYLYYSTHSFLFDQYIMGKGYVVAKSNVSAVKNKWYIVVGTYDKNSIKLYLNGELIAETPATGDIKGSPIEFTIGANPQPEGSNYLYFTSLSTSNALVYNRALTNYEISNYFSNPDKQITYVGDAIYNKSF